MENPYQPRQKMSRSNLNVVNKNQIQVTGKRRVRQCCQADEVNIKRCHECHVTDSWGARWFSLQLSLSFPARDVQFLITWRANISTDSYFASHINFLSVKGLSLERNEGTFYTHNSNTISKARRFAYRIFFLILQK